MGKLRSHAECLITYSHAFDSSVTLLSLHSFRIRSTLSWISGNYCKAGDILRYDASCSNYRTLADGNAWEQNAIATNPDIFTNRNRSVRVATSKYLGLIVRDNMIGRKNLRAITNESPVTNGDTFPT